MCAKQNADAGNGDSSGLPEWTNKYREDYRRFLASFGVNDRGILAVQAYNQEIIDISEHCRGSHHSTFEVLMAWLHEDWATLLQRYGVRSTNRLAPEGRIKPDSDFDWLNEPDGEEDDSPQDLLSIVRLMRAISGIGLTDKMFRRMAAAGFGPLAVGASPYRKSMFLQWQTSVFGVEGGSDLPSKSEVMQDPALLTTQRPKWMLVGESGPYTDYLRDYLRAWGADVLIVELPLEAAQVASSHKGLAGAIIQIPNVQAEFVIADILMRRGIGFLVVAYGGARPAGLELGGALIRNPGSIEEIRAALEALPQRHLKGLDLSVMPKIQWG